jgi:hypothetical protein
MSVAITGGTLGTDYTIDISNNVETITFLSTDISFSIIFPYVVSVNYTLIGGGGGGYYYGGGGGGGQIVTGNVAVLANTSYSVSVGVGGVYSSSDDLTSGASSFDTIYAHGGYNGLYYFGGASGSGGKGGISNYSSDDGYGGYGINGGGGGGGSYEGGNGGNNGDGRSAGGGGGGGGKWTSPGGQPGGGNGGNSGGYKAQPGAANTGGGGGGGGTYNAPGGSGVVVVSYTIPSEYLTVSFTNSYATVSFAGESYTTSDVSNNVSSDYSAGTLLFNYLDNSNNDISGNISNYMTYDGTSNEVYNFTGYLPNNTVSSYCSINCISGQQVVFTDFNDASFSTVTFNCSSTGIWNIDVSFNNNTQALLTLTLTDNNTFTYTIQSYNITNNDGNLIASLNLFFGWMTLISAIWGTDGLNIPAGFITTYQSFLQKK